MPINSFTDLGNAATYAALFAGVWGAILSFLKRDIRKFSFPKTIGLFFMDMAVNMGITMLVYIGAIGYGFNELLAVALAGFLGHQGTRSFYLLELIIAEKLGAKKTFDEIKGDKDA